MALKSLPKFRFFSKNLDLVFIFLRANHGHGGHGNGGRRGIFGGGLSKKKISAGGPGSSFP